MQEPPQAPLPCARCGYLADTSAGPLNFCPKCGQSLRGGSPERDDTMAFLGQVVAERYRLTSLLGEGGMGAVFKAEHVRMGKALAVKLLRGSFARDLAAVERFKTEALVVSRLSDPHTIAVFDFGELRNRDGFYLAMEYVPGQNLAAALRQHGRMEEQRAVGICEQILRSLAEAHERGVVHRDVKPANIMLMPTRDGDFVKVLDFGIAKLRDTTAGDITQGVIIGTPNYLAPEQARGGDVDGRADLYSVGALLYELCSGRCPFIGASPLAVMQAHISQAAPPIRLLAPWVSEPLAEVIHRALLKHPEERFQSADELRQALLDAIGRPSPTLVPIPEPLPVDADLANRADFQDFERQVARLRRSRVSAPLLALLLVGAVALGLWRWPQVFAFLQQRTPAIVELIPKFLWPPVRVEGEEYESNNTPADANDLALPNGGRGEAVMRGHIGGRINSSTGDVDVYRLEIPDLGRSMNLIAEWSSAGPDGPAPSASSTEGIRGLDVKLTLNRVLPGQGPQHAAPLVAQVDKGGPGKPKRLQALVEPGTYFLAVREMHADKTDPVEKPTDWYQLRVHLEAPETGQEVEPNDSPDSVEHRSHRYPEWRAMAERNALAAGARMEGTVEGDDADTFAVGPRDARGAADPVDLVVLIPVAGLSPAVQLWLPDAIDLSPAGSGDRERFAEAGSGGPGEVMAVRLSPAPQPGAPALIRLRAAAGAGRYELLALGPGASSGALVLARIEALSQGGRSSQALELAAIFAREVPASAVRSDVLLSAGRLAEKLAAAARPQDVADYQRVSRRLGAALFEVADGKVRYGSAFEALAGGTSRGTEPAMLRAVERVLPCTPEEVARRAQAFLERFPRSRQAPAVHLQLARALEQAHWTNGDRAALQGAKKHYTAASRGGGPGAQEARDRVRELSSPRAVRPAVTRLRCE